MSSAVIVAALLDLFGSVESAQTLKTSIIEQTVVKYGWHRTVMAALAGLYEGGQISDLPATCHPILLQHVLSSDSLLRSSALQILRASNPTSGIFAKCLEAENTPLTIQSARERVMHIRKVGMLLRNLDTYDLEFRVGIAYCIAALKINFKPLWSEAIESLATFLKDQKSAVEDIVWELLLGELEKAVTGQPELLVLGRPIAWTSEASSEDSELPRLQRGEFRCTSNSRIFQRFHAYLDEINGATASLPSLSLVSAISH